MGNRARGLLGGRRCLGLLPPRPRAQPRLPLGRGRPARPLRPPGAPLLRGGALERRDPILKERLFGLTGPEGNHGEDVKELYFYLDATPTHSYAQGALQVSAAAVSLRAAGRGERPARARDEPEFEIARHRRVRRTGATSTSSLEYAKAAPDDMLIRDHASPTAGPRRRRCVLLPTLWFRNTWSWGRARRGVLGAGESRAWRATATARSTLDAPVARAVPASSARAGERRRARAALHRERDQHRAALRRRRTGAPYVKDAFHDYVVGGRAEAVNPRAARDQGGGRATGSTVPAGGEVALRLRLTRSDDEQPAAQAPFADFDARRSARRAEADEFYARKTGALTADERADRPPGLRRAALVASSSITTRCAHWLEGDPAQPPPPPSRLGGRNAEWRHLYNRDVISMPDKWEYPWYAAWDLAFHMVPLRAHRSRSFAKEQLILLTARVVHAPERAAPRLRVRLRRRQPAGARLGRLARLQDRRRTRRRARPACSWRGCSRSCCSTSPGG